MGVNDQRVGKMEQGYNLRWKTFSDHMFGIFRNLRVEGNFADTTLVSEDQKQFQAHKLVLSACSPVLKNLLVTNPHSHPILYLRGIKQEELEAILNFMYFGEAQISEDSIDAFVNLAKDFKIEDISEQIINGDIKLVSSEILSESKDKEQNSTNDEIIPSAKNTEEIYHKTIHNSEAIYTSVHTEDPKLNENYDECEYQAIHKHHLKKHQDSVHKGIKYQCDESSYKATYKRNFKRHKLTKHKREKIEKKQPSCDFCKKQFTEKGSLSLHIKSIHEKIKYGCKKCEYQATRKYYLAHHITSVHEGGYRCSDCEYQANTLQHLKTHQDLVHKGIKYQCDECHYEANQRNSLRSHKQAKHIGVRFPCSVCEKVFTEKGSLNLHIESVHEKIKYFCKNCDYKTSRKTYLKKHNKLDHE